MIELSGREVADAAGARVVGEGAAASPTRATVDSRQVEAGDLFIGLLGEHADGGRFANEALAAGAWGVIVEPAWVEGLEGGWVLEAGDPLIALHSLARTWRRRLGAKVIGITGSVGKTSVKDIAAAILPGRVHPSPENLNTEIGLPLVILSAPADTDVLVLEMAMRGPGQIAQLAAIAEPQVAVITNVGPVHVELLGSVETIAAVKAEILGGLPADGCAVVPARPGALEPHLGAAPRLLRFGAGGDVEAVSSALQDGTISALVRTPDASEPFRFPFSQAYNLDNALAAIAAGTALGVPLSEMAGRAPHIGFSPLRGERIELGAGTFLVNDCYNANPVSMRAALDHFASLPTPGRRIAVLGEMAELGPDAPHYHREVGDHARQLGIDLLVGVGVAARDYEPDELVADAAEAAELLGGQLAVGDGVLIKASRAAGLELIASSLRRDRGEGVPRWE